ncbi:MAG: tetratricopeptide repeat protein [Pseudohongiellaceae bacterium]
MSFFTELKRRNVIRVAILYAVSAWILLQITEVLTSLLPVPEWTGALVILLLALGFFPALIFAWAYELTPDGIRREKDVDRSMSITGQTAERMNTLIIVLLVVAIATVVVDRMLPEKGVNPAASEAAVEALSDGRPSIAVLPFADLSPDKNQQYFTDGIAEELLNVLVRVDGLRVASRTSSFALRDSGMSVPQLAEELGVQHILEGSMRKDGDQIRVTAQLIRAENDEHLWSENFNRELKDIFRIQDEIASEIVAALQVSLGVGAEMVEVAVNEGTENIDAYDLFLRANELFVSRSDIAGSIELFTQAIQIDPNFARAWEGLAAAEIVFDDWEDYDGVDHWALAESAAKKALAINPELSMANLVLGSLAEEPGRDFVTAMAYYDLALEKDSKNTTAWLWRGMLLYGTGFFADAKESLGRCLEIDPGYLNCKQHLAMAYALAGDMRTADELLAQTVVEGFFSLTEAFVPFYGWNGDQLAAALLANRNGTLTGAPVKYWLLALQNPGEDHSHGYERVKSWQQSDHGVSPRLTYIFMTEYALAAGRFEDVSYLPFAAWAPEGEAFRRSPHFTRVARDTGILRYWQEKGFPPQCGPDGEDGVRCD